MLIGYKILTRTALNKWVLVSALCFLAILAKAAITDTVQYPELNKTYIKSYYLDSKDFLVSPAKWRARQWIGFGMVSGAAVLAYSQDEKIQKYFVGHQSETADNLSKFIFEPIGSGFGTSVILGSLYIGGRLSEDNRLAGTSLTAAKSFVVSSLFAGIVKQLTHRHRPYQDEIPDHSNWDGPFSDIHYTSFPSGHSATAFSIATVFALEYRNTIWIPLVAYTLASGTAVSRLYDNKHWASDVVIGSVLGYVTGRFMWNQTRKGIHRVAVVPSASFNSVGVTFFIRLAEPKQVQVCS